MTSQIQTHRFYKDGLGWYIDLPSFLEQGGSIGDLQMVDGADKMLDMMARGSIEVTVSISTTPFDGSDVLELIEKCEPYMGGAYYLLRNYESYEINQHMWLCQVAEYVLGELPNRIYVKKVSVQ